MSEENDMNEIVSNEFDKIRLLIITHKRIISSGVGSVNRANICYNKVAYRFAKAFEQGYGVELAKLCIKDREPAVRYKGAYFLLPYQTLRAKTVLWQILIRKRLFFQSIPPFVAFNAEAILTQWRKKELKFPRLINGEVKYLNIDKIKEESL